MLIALFYINKQYIIAATIFFKRYIFYYEIFIFSLNYSFVQIDSSQRFSFSSTNNKNSFLSFTLLFIANFSIVKYIVS